MGIKSKLKKIKIVSDLCLADKNNKTKLLPRIDKLNLVERLVASLPWLVYVPRILMAVTLDRMARKASELSLGCHW